MGRGAARLETVAPIRSDILLPIFPTMANTNDQHAAAVFGQVNHQVCSVALNPDRRRQLGSLSGHLRCRCDQLKRSNRPL